MSENTVTRKVPIIQFKLKKWIPKVGNVHNVIKAISTILV